MGLLASYLAAQQPQGSQAQGLGLVTQAPQVSEYENTGSGIGGFIGNVFSDVGDVIGGVFQLIGQGASEIWHEPVDVATEFATLGFADTDVKVATPALVPHLLGAIATDIDDRYLDGDITREFYDHPLSFVFDALAVGGAAGAVARGATGTGLVTSRLARGFGLSAEKQAANLKLLTDYRLARQASTGVRTNVMSSGLRLGLDPGDTVALEAAERSALEAAEAAGTLGVAEAGVSGLETLGQLARRWGQVTSPERKAMMLDFLVPEDLRIAHRGSGYTTNVVPTRNPLMRAVWSDPIRRKLIAESVDVFEGQVDDLRAAEELGTLDVSQLNQLRAMETSLARMKEQGAQFVASPIYGEAFMGRHLKKAANAVIGKIAQSGMMERRIAQEELRRIMLESNVDPDRLDSLFFKELEGIGDIDRYTLSRVSLEQRILSKGFSSLEDGISAWVHGDDASFDVDERRAMFQLVQSGQVEGSDLWRYKPELDLVDLPNRTSFEAKFRSAAERSGLTTTQADMMMATYDAGARGIASQNVRYGGEIDRVFADLDIDFEETWAETTRKALMQRASVVLRGAVRTEKNGTMTFDVERLARLVESDLSDARGWYARSRAFIHQLAGDMETVLYGLDGSKRTVRDVELLADLLAATSVGMLPKRHLPSALKLWLMLKDGTYEANRVMRGGELVGILDPETGRMIDIGGAASQKVVANMVDEIAHGHMIREWGPGGKRAGAGGKGGKGQVRTTVPVEPLVAAMARKGVTPSPSDQKNLSRGFITPRIADRMAVEYLDTTPWSIYGEAWDDLDPVAPMPSDTESLQKIVRSKTLHPDQRLKVRAFAALLHQDGDSVDSLAVIDRRMGLLFGIFSGDHVWKKVFGEKVMEGGKIRKSKVRTDIPQAIPAARYKSLAAYVAEVKDYLNQNLGPDRLPYTTGEVQAILWSRTREFLIEEAALWRRRVRGLSGEEHRRAHRYLDMVEASITEDLADADDFLKIWDEVGGTKFGKAMQDRLQRFIADPKRLAQQINAEIKGATLFGEDFKSFMKIYRSGDITTYVHEFAHVLRRMFPSEISDALNEIYFRKAHGADADRAAVFGAAEQADELFQEESFRVAGEGDEFFDESGGRYSRSDRFVKDRDSDVNKSVFEGPDGRFYRQTFEWIGGQRTTQMIPVPKGQTFSGSEAWAKIMKKVDIADEPARQLIENARKAGGSPPTKLSGRVETIAENDEHWLIRYPSQEEDGKFLWYQLAKDPEAEQKHLSHGAPLKGRPKPLGGGGPWRRFGVEAAEARDVQINPTYRGAGERYVYVTAPDGSRVHEGQVMALPNGEVVRVSGLTKVTRKNKQVWAANVDHYSQGKHAVVPLDELTPIESMDPVRMGFEEPLGFDHGKGVEVMRFRKWQGLEPNDQVTINGKPVTIAEFRLFPTFEFKGRYTEVTGEIQLVQSVPYGGTGPKYDVADIEAAPGTTDVSPVQTNPPPSKVFYQEIPTDEMAIIDDAWIEHFADRKGKVKVSADSELGKWAASQGFVVTRGGLRKNKDGSVSLRNADVPADTPLGQIVVFHGDDEKIATYGEVKDIRPDDQRLRYGNDSREESLERTKGKPAKELPIGIIRNDGLIVLIEGNHRRFRAIEAGEPLMRYVEIDPSNRLRTLREVIGEEEPVVTPPTVAAIKARRDQLKSLGADDKTLDWLEANGLEDYLWHGLQDRAFMLFAEGDYGKKNQAAWKKMSAQEREPFYEDAHRDMEAAGVREQTSDIPEPEVVEGVARAGAPEMVGSRRVEEVPVDLGGPMTRPRIAEGEFTINEDLTVTEEAPEAPSTAAGIESRLTNAEEAAAQDDFAARLAAAAPPEPEAPTKIRDKDVEVGAMYRVKVGEKMRLVRITGVNKYGGWDGLNVDTGRPIRIKTARRLRELVHPNPVNQMTDAEVEAEVARIPPKLRETLEANIRAREAEGPPEEPPPAAAGAPPIGPDDGRWTRQMEEAFAEDLERWFKGKTERMAMDASLPGIFRGIFQQIVETWKKVRGYAMTHELVPPESAAVFDEYLGSAFTAIVDQLPKNPKLPSRRTRHIDVPALAYPNAAEVKQFPGTPEELRRRAIQGAGTFAGRLRGIFGDKGVNLSDVMKPLERMVEHAQKGRAIMDPLRARVIVESWKQVPQALQAIEAGGFQILGVVDTQGTSGRGGRRAVTAYVVDPEVPDLVAEVEVGTPLFDRWRQMTSTHERKLADVGYEIADVTRQIKKAEREATEDSLAAAAELTSLLEALEAENFAGDRKMQALSEMVADEIDQSYGRPTPGGADRDLINQTRLWVARNIEAEMLDAGWGFTYLFDRDYLPLRIRSGAAWNAETGEWEGGLTASVLDDESSMSGLPAPVYFPHIRGPVNTGDFVLSRGGQGIRKMAQNKNLKRNKGDLFRTDEYIKNPMEAYSIRAARAVKMRGVYELVAHVTNLAGRPIAGPDDLLPGEKVFAPDFIKAYFRAVIGVEDRIGALLSNIDDEALFGALDQLTAKGGRENAVEILTEGVSRALDVGEMEEGALYAAVSDAMPKARRELLALTNQGVQLYAIPKVVSDQLNNSIKYQFGPGVRLFWDKPLQVWKSITLYGRPAWVLNNILGNTIFSKIGSVRVREVLQYALDDDYRMYVDEIARQAGMADEIGQGYISSTDIAPTHLGSVSVDTLTGQALKRLEDWSSRSRVMKPFHRYADWWKNLNTNVENAYRKVGFVAGLRRAGAEVVGGPDRMGLRKASRSFWTAKEEMQRMLVEGFTPKRADRALQLTNEWFGDFRSLGPVERGVLRRFIFPFWGFYRHIFQLAMKLPSEYPLKMSVARGMALYAEELRQEIGPLPTWMEGLVPFGLMKPDGTQDFLSVAGPNPFNVFMDIGLGLFNPAIKVAIEQMTGRDAFTGRPFSDPDVVTPYGSSQQYQIIRGPDGVPIDAIPVEKVTQPPGVALLSQIPQYDLAKNLLAGGRAYDTSGLLGAIQDGPVTDSAGNPIAPFGPLDALGRLGGVSTYTYDVAAFQERLARERENALMYAYERWAEQQAGTPVSG